MSKFTDSFWRRVQSQTAQYEPQVRVSLLKAIGALKTHLDDTEVERLLANRQLPTLVLKVFDQATLDRSFAVVDVAIQRTAQKGLENAVRTLLPDGGKLNGVVSVHFDVTDSNIINAVKDLSDRIVKPLKADVQQVAQQVIEDGVKRGLNPRQIKRDLGNVIGVSPTQADAIANFRGMLEANSREALTRELRDPRFDSTLERVLGSGGKGLSETQIDRMTTAYARRMVAFNAETVARTATLDSLKAGQNMSWLQAIDAGVVDGDLLLKRWVGVKDDRERDEHWEMEGETVAFDDEYSNGEMIPGDSTYNCRCVSYVFEASDQAAYEKALDS